MVSSQCAQMLLPGVRHGHQAAAEPDLPNVQTAHRTLYPQLLLSQYMDNGSRGLGRLHLSRQPEEG